MSSGERVYEVSAVGDLRLYARWSAVGVEQAVNPWPWLLIGFCCGVLLWLVLWFAGLKGKLKRK